MEHSERVHKHALANPSMLGLTTSGSFRGSLRRGELHKQASFHLQKHVTELVEAIQKDPTLDLDDRIGPAIEADFPQIHHFPTPEEIDLSIQSIPSNKNIKFEKGSWCEFLGKDMKWHLAQVRRVVRIAPDKYDPVSGAEPVWEYWYQFTGGSVAPPHEVRASEEALKRTFGLRPWVWQQWALLQTEDFCRLQYLHERDFELINFAVSASVLFKRWLKHPSNADFRALFESRPAHERERLIHHLTTPFELMNQIVTKTLSTSWNFNGLDVGLSIYSYQSVLGSGWTSALLVMCIQLIIPALLLYSALDRSKRVDFADGSSFEDFCKKDGEIDGLIVNFCVIIFYGIRQMPKVMYTFFETVGEADTARSKLNSLRTLVWETGRDTLGMQIGFKMERYMNSTYIAGVNNLMLLVLFLQRDPSEIILNAIAIEFVLLFSKEVAQSEWYDHDFRYIRAGIVELVMRSVLDTRALSEGKRFCKKFDIDYKRFSQAVAEDGFGTSIGLKSRALAKKDAASLAYTDAKGKVWRKAEEYAAKTNNADALWVFRERHVRFDVVFRWLSLFKLGGTSIFHRYDDFQTWSRWEKVLFMSPCSEVDATTRQVEEPYRPSMLVSIQEDLQDRRLEAPYLNESLDVQRTVFERFVMDIVKTLTFQSYIASVRNAWGQKSLLGLLFRLIDGILEWIAFLYQIIFPFTLFGYAVLLFTCY